MHAELGVLAALFWAGCSVPPDWSVCECQWLDNHWFHHINILNEYTGDHFLQYLASPGHPLHNWIMSQTCPAQVTTFLYNGENKVYGFDPQGLMKLSHEAYRPENRETIKHACPVGNMILHFWCAHQFLWKAGSPSVPANETVRWGYLRSWYSHMRSLQQFADQPEIAACLKRCVFPFNETTATALVDWTYKSIGNSSSGEEPRLLFNSGTGLVHIPSFAFTHTLRHSRRGILPKNRVCLPLADPTCWPAPAVWQADSCSLCCDPSKGPYGDASCWGRPDASGRPRTYERCCQQDFKHVMCEEIRKSTPGCLDCPQSLSFFCEEVHKFQSVKAWQFMNHTYHEFLAELELAKNLTVEVEGNKSLLAVWEAKHSALLPTFVKQETQYHTSLLSQPEFRLGQSRMLMDNRTYSWLQWEEKESVETKFRNANSSLFDNRRKEGQERVRKDWVIERLLNYSVELVNVTAELAKVDYTELWQRANVSTAHLRACNDTLVRAEEEVNVTKEEIVKLQSAVAGRSEEVGLTQLRLQLSQEKADVGKVKAGELVGRNTELAKAKANVAELENAKRACEETHALDAEKRALETRARGIEVERARLEKVEVGIRADILQVQAEQKKVRSGFEESVLLEAMLEIERVRSECWKERVGQCRSGVWGDTAELVELDSRAAGISRGLEMTMDRLRLIKKKASKLSVGGRVHAVRARVKEVRKKFRTSLTEIDRVRAELVRRKLELRGRLSGIKERAVMETEKVKADLFLLGLDAYFAQTLFSQRFPSFIDSIILGGISVLVEFAWLIQHPWLEEVRWVRDVYVAAADRRREVDRQREQGSSIAAMTALAESARTMVNLKRSELKGKIELATKIRNELIRAKRELELEKVREWHKELVEVEVVGLERNLLMLRRQLAEAKSASQLVKGRILVGVECALTSSHAMREIERSVAVLESRLAAQAGGFASYRNSTESLEQLIERLNATEQAIEKSANDAKMDEVRLSAIGELRANAAQRCGRFRDKKLEHALSQLESAQKRFNETELRLKEMELRVENISAQIVGIENGDGILVELTREMSARTTRLTAELEPELARERQNQSTALNQWKSSVELIKYLEARELALRKRLAELEIDQPKLEAELSVKDELILNITRKQNEAAELLVQLAPEVEGKRANFSVWDFELAGLDSDIREVNESLSLHREEVGNVTVELLSGVEGVSEYHEVNALYKNVSFYLNETFYNLTLSQDLLSNSTKRIHELVDTFKESERTYAVKEEELRVYHEQVAKGLLPKVDFKFEY